MTHGNDSNPTITDSKPTLDLTKYKKTDDGGDAESVRCTLKYWNIYVPYKTTKTDSNIANSNCDSNTAVTGINDVASPYEIELTVSNINPHTNVKRYFIYKPGKLF